MGWRRSIGLVALTTTATVTLLFAAPAAGHDVLTPDGGKVGSVSDDLDGGPVVTTLARQPTLDDLVRSARVCTFGHHSVFLQLVFQGDGSVRTMRVAGRDDKITSCVRQVFARAHVTPFVGGDRSVAIIVWGF